MRLSLWESGVVVWMPMLFSQSPHRGTSLFTRSSPCLSKHRTHWYIGNKFTPYKLLTSEILYTIHLFFTYFCNCSKKTSGHFSKQNNLSLDLGFYWLAICVQKNSEQNVVTHLFLFLLCLKFYIEKCNSKKQMYTI